MVHRQHYPEGNEIKAMAESITLTVDKLSEELELEPLTGSGGTVTFTSAEIGRPGLQFTGYYDHFSSRRVQIIGMSEMYYLYGLSGAEVRARMKRFMSYGVPCVVCARGNMPPKELIESAREHGLPVFLSHQKTDDIGHRISNYLSRKLAPSMLTHGVLMDVFGVGILMRGESGLGKSETALEMIKQGHRLVADDVVRITRVASGRIVGTAPEATKYLIEVRGIGIVDVRYLFGVGSAVNEKSIDFIMDLEMFDPTAQYERIGAREKRTELLGVEIPTTVLPVSPGRNIAVVVEVAARNFLLKKLGYDTSGHFAKRMESMFEGKK